MMVSIIAAVSQNGVIGRGGSMPWRIPGEQKRFRELTLHKTVIMGRITFEEIGKPLPGRKTVVISRTKEYNFPDLLTVKSLDEAYDLLRGEEEVFIAGGGQLYKSAMPHVFRIYLTLIHKDFPGDVYFPPIKKEQFCKIFEKSVPGPIPYTYYTYERV